MLDGLSQRRLAPDTYRGFSGEINMDTQLLEEVIHDEQIEIDVRNAQRDLIILKYMAWRLHSILYQLDQAEKQGSEQPLLRQVQERCGRNHRIVIYRQQELLQLRSFAFVGFISKRKGVLQPEVVEAIKQTDQKLVAELVHAPSILSYSSLELPGGDWCNLVVLADSGAKMHIKNSETHIHAAHHLAHDYYKWIRLHNGTMPEGLDPVEMRLLSTKYYTFHPDQQRPSLRERTYGTRQVKEIKTRASQ